MLHIIVIHILHTFIQMCATSCVCMWHACSAEPIFVYAAHMQYGCIVRANHHRNFRLTVDDFIEKHAV